MMSTLPTRILKACTLASCVQRLLSVHDHRKPDCLVVGAWVRGYKWLLDSTAVWDMWAEWQL